MGITALALLVAPALPQTAEVEWFEGPFSNALGKANAAERQIFLYFWAEGSDFCTRVYRETLSDAGAVGELGSFLCYSANAAHPSGARLVQRYNVTTLPTMLIVGCDGRPEDALVGYVSLPVFTSEIQRIRAGTGTVSTLRKLADEAPNDLQRRFDLATKLQSVGAEPEALELLDSIRKDDPEGRTVIGAQLALWDVRNSITETAADPNDPTTYDLAPMYAHLPKIHPEPVRFRGWDWVAQIENAKGEREKACRAYEEAWKFIPEATVGDWGFSLVDLYWGMRDKLTSRDKAFALTVATRVAERVRSFADKEPADRFGMDDARYTEYLAEFLELLARCQFMNGDVAGATATIEEAIALQPDNGEFRARLELFKQGEVARK